MIWFIFFNLIFIASSASPRFPNPPESYFASGPWQLDLNGTIVVGEGSYASSFVLKRRMEILIAQQFAQQWYYDWNKGLVYALTTDEFPVCQKLQLSTTIMPSRWHCFLAGAVYKGLKPLPVISLNNLNNDNDNDNNNHVDMKKKDNNLEDITNRSEKEPVYADFWESSLAIIAVSPTDPNRILLFHHLASNLIKLFHTFTPINDRDSPASTIMPFLMPPFICLNSNNSGTMPAIPCE